MDKWNIPLHFFLADDNRLYNWLEILIFLAYLRALKGKIFFKTKRP